MSPKIDWDAEPVQEKIAIAPAQEQVITPRPRVKPVEKLPQDLRDDLVGLKTVLDVLGNWDRFKKGYRPGNEKLHDVIDKLGEMLKKY